MFNVVLLIFLLFCPFKYNNNSMYQYFMIEWFELKGLTPEFEVSPQLFNVLPHAVFAPPCGQSQTCINDDTLH